MSDDTTSRRVRQILLGAAREAYDFPRQHEPEPTCGCTHGTSAHHGKDGELHCGEDGCGCLAFWDPEDGCPECGTKWPNTMQPCPGCGLTIEAIAGRLAGGKE